MPVAKPAAAFALLLVGSCLSLCVPPGPGVAAAQALPQAPPASPEPAPADPAVEGEVRKLLAGFADDNSRVRQRAEDAIVELGTPAKPVIENVLTTPEADDVEVRTRLESALRRIESNRLTGTSYVTLSLKDATPADAFSELSKQAMAPIRPYPDDLWNQVNWSNITLDVQRKPFWAAAQELAAKAGVGLQASNDGLRIVRAPGQIGGPSIIHGAFLVVATQVNRTQTIVLGDNAAGQAARPPIVRGRTNEFGVHLLVLPEPKLSVVRVNSGVKLEQAVDEKGNDLAPPAGAGGHGYASGMAGAWNVYARLNYPAAPGAAGQSIARLAGTVTFVVQTKSQKIEIPDPLALKDAFRVVGGSRVTFHGMTKTGERYELKVSLTPDGNAGAGADGSRAMSSLFQSMQFRLRVLNAAGEPLDRRGLSSEGNGRETRVTLHFASPRGAAPGGDPVRLEWDVPTETKEVDVPFEFKDLPMP